MTLKVLVNGLLSDRVSVGDRGLQYGDGLFETIAFNQKPLLWQQHLQRLNRGCQQLGITPVSESQWLNDLETLEPAGNCVIKLIVTRGEGGRGYAPPESPLLTRIVQLHPDPDYPENYSEDGVDICMCETPVSMNSKLAGLKHLNRLDSVLARQEVIMANCQEGVMCDAMGNVIECTQSNLFIVNNHELFTPDLIQAGVAGIMRQRVIETAHAQEIPVTIDILTCEQLEQAEEIFVTNSLIGIWPVKKFMGRQYSTGKITRQLQS